jgi:hypothetical protein
MMDKEVIFRELDTATALLKKAVASFTLEKFNEKPPGKWGASQIMEHLLMTESSISKLLGKSSGEAGRPPGKKLDMINTVMGDDNNKYNAPEIFLPPGRFVELEVVDQVAEIRNGLKEIIAASNLDEMISIKHPGLGSLTRIEWVYFLIHHSNRHTRQIENLLL